MSLFTFRSTRPSFYVTCRSLGLVLVLWVLFCQFSLAQSITIVAGGAGAGPLNEPTGICLDGAGNLYVADRVNHRIQKFPPNSTTATVGTTVAGGNGEGTAANQLKYPVGVYVDGAGSIYVADALNNRIQKFPPTSTSVTSGSTVAGGLVAGSAANQLLLPTDVFVDGSGNIYVVEQNNFRVQKFPPNSTSGTAGITVAGGNAWGSASNQLGGPNGIFIDASENLYVADRFNHRVLKFPPNSTSTTAGIIVAGGNGFGRDATQLNQPTDIVVDGMGNLYVAELGNDRVQMFPPNSTSATAGINLAGVNGYGFGPGQLAYAYGVCVDGSGNLYVSEQNGRTVKKYNYPPIITSQPVASSSVCSGANVTAQVSASATIPGPAFTYQWYSASGPLSGQTSPILSLSNVQPGHTSSYYAIITSTPSGLSTSSTSYQLSVLAAPNASLVASSSLSPSRPTVTLTASGGTSYQFSSGAAQVVNGPTAIVSTPGLYVVNVTGANGCSTIASTSVSQATTADLSPLIYTLPSSLYGNTPVTVVVDVVEVNGLASRGIITLKISQEAGLPLSLPADATLIGGRQVNNPVWELSGPNDGVYTLTTSQVIPASSKLSVGLMGNFNPGGSKGRLSLSATLQSGSGGDERLDNNTDADRLDYF